ncbi:hypothetical protein NDU88_001094 [Pleurodeles waltl]|uniref:Uncharacterized protein n=1 Tax=Pleurodeles waltl TaxID=8319 RepID=A0AAV7Q7K3_PLEWA|nr:hypothetical protein NDU88_001094 [Pleurodeles waltl]
MRPVERSPDLGPAWPEERAEVRSKRQQPGSASSRVTGLLTDLTGSHWVSRHMGPNTSSGEIVVITNSVSPGHGKMKSQVDPVAGCRIRKNGTETELSLEEG